MDDNYFKASRESCVISHLIDNTMLGQARFKTDWNWLIPVLKKISQKDDIAKNGVAFTMSKYEYDIDEIWAIVVKHLELHGVSTVATTVGK